MKIKWVGQKHQYGCSIACISMILGTDYDIIEKHFKENLDKKGIATSDAIAYLAEQGLNIIVKESVGMANVKLQNKLLLLPFAEVHLLSVKQFMNNKIHHSIVMDNKGNIFDPDDVTRKDLKLFYSIETVVGCFK